MIVFEHTPPAVLIWLSIALAILAAAFSIWRFMPRKAVNYVIGALHVCFLLLLAWCLFQPGRRDVEINKLKPRFVIAVDTSRSMLISPSTDIPSRWSVAAEALAMPWTATVAADCDIERYAFSSNITKRLSATNIAALTPQGESTLLRDCLQEINGRYAGMNVAGALLLSDGIDTREAADDWAVDTRAFPVYTVRLEPDTDWEVEPDLHIDSANTPRRTTVGWKTELTTVISGQGSGGQPVSVQLFRNDVLHQEKPTQLPDTGGARETSFELEHPEVGVFKYRVHVPPLPGELSTNDNDFAVSVQVVDARNRLLYVEGPPRWEYKYLRRALVSNRQITPVIFYAGFDGKPHGGVPVGNLTSDMTESELAMFKVVVIGNLNAEELSEPRARNLVKYVETGGSLVLLGGTGAWGEAGLSTTVLRSIMPVRQHAQAPVQGEDPFAVHISDAGKAHPAFAGDPEFWNVVPPLISIFPQVELSPGAQALVEVETPQGVHPVVVSHRYGEGKVVAIFTDSLWKWQLSSDAVASKPYQRFWDQLIAWLLPAEQDLDTQGIEIFADRDGLFLGEEVEISARMDDETAGADIRVQCIMIMPDKRQVPYAMSAQPVTTPSGRTYPGYTMPFKADMPGLYTATAVAGTGDSVVKSLPLSFFVKPFTPESVPRPIHTAVLQTIAQSSGGRFFENLDDMNRALTALDANPIEEQTVEYSSLWQIWPIIVLLMLLSVTLWSIRKFGNMP